MNLLRRGRTDLGIIREKEAGATVVGDAEEAPDVILLGCEGVEIAHLRCDSRDRHERQRLATHIGSSFLLWQSYRASTFAKLTK